jgi:hypothetical protein
MHVFVCTIGSTEREKDRLVDGFVQLNQNFSSGAIDKDATPIDEDLLFRIESNANLVREVV